MFFVDTEAKLDLISSQMHLEPAEETGPTGRAASQSPHTPGPCGHSPAEWQKLSRIQKKESPVHMATMRNGKKMALFKSMLTTACERDCYYCPFRAGRSMRRASFKPDEMAKTFAEMNKSNVAEGIFLSSGILKGGVSTQDRLLDSIDILRHKHHFNGYVHLKIMPGAEKDQLIRAMQLADRISVNLEAPNDKRLPSLAPHKMFFDELLNRLQWADEIRRTMTPEKTFKKRWPSLVTQFVVGAAGEKDVEILSTTDYLYRKLKLARAYYSAFNPIRDTPLENTPAENPWREHRLYQSSFLLQDYDFELEELPFDQTGNLPIGVDPKQAWAELNLAETPVELNRADRRSLMRVPGIGATTAEAIIAARRTGTLSELKDLNALGAPGVVKRAAPYILLNGKRPEQPAIQLSLL